MRYANYENYGSYTNYASCISYASYESYCTCFSIHLAGWKELSLFPGFRKAAAWRAQGQI